MDTLFLCLKSTNLPTWLYIIQTNYLIYSYLSKIILNIYLTFA